MVEYFLDDRSNFFTTEDFEEFTEVNEYGRPYSITWDTHRGCVE